MISGLVPASHAKVLTNIRKTQERVKRKKQQREEGGQEDGDEEEDMFVSKQQPERLARTIASVSFSYVTWAFNPRRGPW